MLIDALIEIALTVLVLAALAITCAVLLSIRPPKPPPPGTQR
ncbi:hypothetical protein SAMN05216266_11176 [Amycolatopsis marina]|uniref:Uncharacterized protein n=1 Tax=Amycolatopsis marina TaxID=490629 RepID=A0A1I1AYV5_9PSEU|nr:hypothetical protein [Amycolatopsis marina]SFB43254.1 hypothetical protein SAMN05216266_11176 [Amycolatopsis marina]